MFLILSLFLQAVVNSRDEERERLRLELKAAQEELNMLREIQRRVSGSNSAALAPVQGRPQSFISDASSYSDTEAVANTEEEEIQGRTWTEFVCESRVHQIEEEVVQGRAQKALRICKFRVHQIELEIQDRTLTESQGLCICVCVHVHHILVGKNL